VKPSNLILTPSGSVVLVDFGISEADAGAGTPGYRAPEVAAGSPATPAADVYGFAATAFALLTGRPPGGTLPAWDGVEASIVPALERTIRRGLAIEPERRPGSASEFVQRLRAVRG
jgi:serine/threonine protein kinase